MTKAAAPLPRHPTPCSSMKLALFTVLSFGIVGKCLLKAAFGGRKSKPPWTQASPRQGCFGVRQTRAAVKEKPGHEAVLALAAVDLSRRTVF